jgi:hypothetical protein
VRGKRADRSTLTSEARAPGVQSFGEFGEFEPLSTVPGSSWSHAHHKTDQIKANQKDPLVENPFTYK